jgi:hypothetical protein
MFLVDAIIISTATANCMRLLNNDVWEIVALQRMEDAVQH